MSRHNRVTTREDIGCARSTIQKRRRLGSYMADGVSGSGVLGRLGYVVPCRTGTPSLPSYVLILCVSNMKSI